MTGLLNNLASNPLFNVGMGLLSQGPSRYPINPWQGVQQGLLNAQHGQRQNAAREQAAVEEQRAQQAHQMEQQKARYDLTQQKAEASRGYGRRAQEEQYLAQLPPEERPLAEMMGVDEHAKLKAKQQYGAPKERRIVKGIDGRSYYADTQEPVLKNIQKQQEAMSPYQAAQLKISQSAEKRDQATSDATRIDKDRKLRENAAKVAAGKETQKTNMRVVADKIEEALPLIDKWFASGAGSDSYFGNISGGPGQDLQAAIDTIQANLSFEALMEMKAASATGSALGAINTRELELLGSRISSLSRKQSDKSLRANLLFIKAKLEEYGLIGNDGWGKVTVS